MVEEFSRRRHFAFATLIAAGLSLAPITLCAQTLDRGVGTGPSRELSTPPNAAPINQPGAMRRAYDHPKRVLHKTHKTVTSKSRQQLHALPQ